jgi:hypothetical protein
MQDPPSSLFIYYNTVMMICRILLLLTQRDRVTWWNRPHCGRIAPYSTVRDLAIKLYLIDIDFRL